ncbi:MAG TPA: DJ-1/PfpI family protein [Candidatus Hydrogenedentes bacterium]|jgi:4-methyl-5(b-hydroxyethyl)-thiazole monophosphate biosynthesis|nr:DJ-1/PfpI family protein [Candidatus Hydrogenedentota bacterium]
MPSVLVPLAEGFEEIEAITLIDILRRAEFDVVTASLGDEAVEAAHGVSILADCTLDEALEKEYDMVVLPGGLPGADYLDNDARIHQLLKKTAESGRFVGAICAAPKVLANARLLDGKKATSYPGFVDKMDLPTTTYTGSAVETDGKVITSRGPGTAMDFALAIIEALDGPAKRKAVEDGLMRN